MNVPELLKLAKELAQSGDRAKATKIVVKILEQQPDHLESLYFLAQLMQTPQQKQKVLTKILRMNPGDQTATKQLAEMALEDRLTQASNFAKGGQQEKALELVEAILKAEPENARAWFLKAKLSKNRQVAQEALNQVIRLSPDDQKAKDILARINSDQKTEDLPKQEKEFLSGRFIIFAALFVFASIMCVGLVYPFITNQLNSVANAATEDALLQQVAGLSLESCKELIERALKVADEGCQQLGNNEACYGNQSVHVELVPDSIAEFVDAGDRVKINEIIQLEAAPLDFAEQIWGVAILKLQSDLPGTVPGQNVTFVVFGDTQIQNDSGDMSAFYFTSGFTGITCEEVDFNGLSITMPDGSSITFMANGVTFTIQGDAILTANAGGEMEISMLDGTGEMSANGQTVTFGAGSSVSVPLDSDLNPNGPISDPVVLSPEELAVACALIGFGCPSEDGLTATPVPPTNTAESDDTSESTNTSVPGTPGEPTNTSVPLSTSTSESAQTDTPIPATSESSTSTSVPNQTNTPVPPPANTNTPKPTNTRRPPNTPPGQENTPSGGGGKPATKTPKP